MPIFHFNTFDGRTSIDPTGTELASWQEARLEAIRLAGAVIQEEVVHLAMGNDWRMEVTDHQGLILFRLDFHVSMSSATISR